MMNEKLRSQIILYLLCSDSEDRQVLKNIFDLSGFNCSYFYNVSDTTEAILKEPPHILFICPLESSFAIWQQIEQWKNISPESTMVFFILQKELEFFGEKLSKIKSEIIIKPALAFQIMNTLDRIAEKNILQFDNEELASHAFHLEEENKSLHCQLPQFQQLNKIHNTIIFDQIWLSMESCKSPQEILQVFLQNILKKCNAKAGFFMKYVPNKKSLIVTESTYLSIKDAQSLNIEFEDDNLDKIDQTLRQTKTISKVIQKIYFVFKLKEKDIFTTPLFYQNEVAGIFVFLQLSTSPENLQMIGQIKKFTELFYACKQNEFELFNFNFLPDYTNFLSKTRFEEFIKQEISRSRRLELPVSLIVFNIRNYNKYVELHGVKGWTALLRYIKIIANQTSRLTDRVGDLWDSFFGIVLPHTNKNGALIRAERLQRSLETMPIQFKNSLDGEHLHINVGICEYPSLCYDGETLLHLALETCEEATRKGFNKIAISNPLESFQPDFPTQSEF